MIVAVLVAIGGALGAGIIIGIAVGRPVWNRVERWVNDVPDVTKNGQQSPRGVDRPPVITVQGETPPPVHYIPEGR